MYPNRLRPRGSAGAGKLTRQSPIWNPSKIFVCIYCSLPLFMFISVSSIRAGTVIIRLFINYSIPSVHYPCLQNIGNLTFNFFCFFSSLISLNLQFSNFIYLHFCFNSHFPLNMVYFIIYNVSPLDLKQNIQMWLVCFLLTF